MAARSMSLVVAIGVTFVGCSRPPSAALRFAPAGMNPTGVYTADPSGSVTFSGSGGLQLRLYLERGVVLITVRAAAEGTAPRVTIYLDERVAGEVKIDPQSFGDYQINARLSRSGTVSMRLSVSGDEAAAALGAAPVRIETVSVWQP
ncbi:MAG: hypothetical protein ACHQ9S_02600 [Candidatus Binatia bacterium]